MAYRIIADEVLVRTKFSYDIPLAALRDVALGFFEAAAKEAVVDVEEHPVLSADVTSQLSTIKLLKLLRHFYDVGLSKSDNVSQIQLTLSA
jgi:hypothetical protein